MPRRKQPATEVPVQQVQTVPPTPQPLPPSPAVLSLQDDVVALVRKRDALVEVSALAQKKLYNAQAEVQGTHADIQAAEQSIQYRLSLIAQLENRASVLTVNHSGTGWPAPPMPSMQGVSAEPAPRQPSIDDLVSRGHASRADFSAM